MSDELSLEPFIPSILDDAGLSAAEFRVYCRIKRRGDCTESVPNIATGCRLNRDTVWDALARLVELGMVSRVPRPGATTMFRAMPPSSWKIPSGKGGVAEKEGRPSKSADTQRKTRGDHPAEKRGHKGNPSEGNPIKAIHTIKRVASNLATLAPTTHGRRTAVLVSRCAELFGEDEMKRNHSTWYQRARDNWDKLDAVLREVTDTMKREQLNNPAAFAESLWIAWLERN